VLIIFIRVINMLTKRLLRRVQSTLLRKQFPVTHVPSFTTIGNASNTTMIKCCNFSTADGALQRGKYPPYVPLAAVPKPTTAPTLSIDTAMAIVDSINSILEHGHATSERFNVISKTALNAGVKWHLLTEVIIETQMYAAVPFGFESSQQGLQNYTMALGQLGSQLPNEKSQDYIDLNEAMQDIWEIGLKKVFGVGCSNKLTLEQIQSLSIKMSAAMQDAAFLKNVEDIVKPLPDMQKHVALEEISYEVYLPVMQDLGFEGDAGYGQLRVEIMHKMPDPQVQMNFLAMQRAVMTKAGLV
jgi:hypothetical protein